MKIPSRWSVIALVFTLTSPMVNAFELVIGAPKTEPLSVPFCVDFDDQGNLYGVEFEPGHRVFRLDEGGKFEFLGGKKGIIAPKENTGHGDGGPIAEALFSGMHDLAVTRAGIVYLADSWAGRIRRFDPKDGKVETIAGNQVKGDEGDGGPAREAKFRQTFACALSPDESQLFVVDIESRKVRSIRLQNGIVEAFAGNGERGVPKDGFPAKEQPLFNPRAIAVHPKDGTVYIIDRDRHSVLRIDQENQIQTVVNAAGKQGSSGDGSDALRATLNGPKHGIVDSRGRLILADAENHTIRRYDPSTGKISLLAGEPEKQGDHLDQNSVLLRRPHGVRLSRDEEWLYIVDSYNDRVIRVRYDRFEE